MRIRILVALASGLCFSAASPAQSPRAAPVVIFDNGAAVPIQLSDGIELDGPAAPAAPPAPRLQPQIIFPVKSSVARPGILGPARKAGIPGGPDVPICIVGDDQLSKHWLALNRQALIKMGAACLVASVSDLRALENLRSAAGELKLIPGSVDALAGAAGITVWPVLITPDGTISQ